MLFKVGLGVCWIGAAVLGLTLLMDYDSAPGMAAVAPDAWPTQSAIHRDPDGPTLVMLAHPRCDCTRASVGELAELMARAKRRPRAYVVFIKPNKIEGGWERTSLWKAAANIPGVTVLRDDSGREAARFGAATSGQVLLYGADGHLQFSGGTTAARGKAGESRGRTSLVALLNGDHPSDLRTPVFGCDLFGPGDDPDSPHADHAHES